MVVTGFGRYDTHELPNSLTWGPDGYLYGLNGVFNEAVIKQHGKEFRFTCAMFRINPRTREFELFCEGTSNPWGIAWDPRRQRVRQRLRRRSSLASDRDRLLPAAGRPVSAVHLDSAVDRQAAGIRRPPIADCCTWIPTPFREKYRDKLLMGNIHGGCLNVDSLRRNGSTYIASTSRTF